jgi:hypothetical protein
MHHVEALEHCVTEVAAALRHDGLLYLDEYIGPSRADWQRSLLAAADAVYRELPIALRRGSRVPLPLMEDDPSEAVRSAEIIEAVASRFSVEAYRPYGGNSLALIHPLVRWEGLAAHERDELLQWLLVREGALLAGGCRRSTPQ